MPAIEAAGSDTLLIVGLILGGAFVVGILLFGIVFCAAKSTKIERGAKRLACWSEASSNKSKASGESILEESLAGNVNQYPSYEAGEDPQRAGGQERQEGPREINKTTLTSFSDFISPPPSHSHPASPAFGHSTSP